MNGAGTTPLPGPVLVAGATGRQGGAVVRHLLAGGASVRALCRDSASPRAARLASLGVEVVAGDLDDPASLRRACAGAHGVFSVQDFTVGAQREVRQGVNLADAAAAEQVAQLVYASVCGADRASGVAHWESKWQVEQHIRRSGIPATILRPVSFMENYYIPVVEKGLLRGHLVDPVLRRTPYQTIAVDDLGAFAAFAFFQPGRVLGKEIELAGSSLTNAEAADVFARVLQRRVRYHRLPLTVARFTAGPEFARMFRWFNEHGYGVDLAALHEAFPDARLRTLEEWLRDEGWAGRRAVAVARDGLGRLQS